MIYLGSDHAGWKLKQDLKTVLGELGQPYEDLGNQVEDPQDDYPDYALAVAEKVAENPGSMGILTCGSGEGVCIAANKVKGVRAVAVYTHDDAAKTREHNDANVLCLSGWHLTIDDARPVVEAFLATTFPGDERHVRRLKKISEYEAQHAR